MREMKDFEHWIDQNYDKIKHYAECHGWEEKAEDITQEVFMKAWEKREELFGHDNIGGWLMSTAKNIIRNHYKRLLRESQMLTEEAIWQIGGTEKAYGLIEWEVMLEDRMSRQDYRLFLEHYLFGISISSLAKRESTNEAALRMKLCRLKNKLKSDVIKHNN